MKVSNTLLGAFYAGLLVIGGLWLLVPKDEGWELLVLYAAVVGYPAMVILGIPAHSILQRLRVGTPLSFAVSW
jgi:hypothetical protein